MILVLYFFFIRPQMNRQKKQRAFQTNLKKGQRIVTQGGIHGKIHQADEGNSWVMLEVGNTKFRVEKSAISFEQSSTLSEAKKEA